MNIENIQQKSFLQDIKIHEQEKINPPTEQEEVETAFHKNIDGFLSDAEALELYRLAKKLKGSRPVVVELGSWLGKSSYLLAKGVENKGNPLVYCIDPFNSEAMSEQSLTQRRNILTKPLKQQFIDNMKQGGVLEHIRILEGYSYDFAEEFEDDIDLLFVDASHEYDDVLRDFELWTKHLKSGGYLVLDDVYVTGDIKHEGPKKVVEKFILNNPKWEVIKLVDAMLIVKKR